MFYAQSSLTREWELRPFSVRMNPARVLLFITARNDAVLFFTQWVKSNKCVQIGWLFYQFNVVLIIPMLSSPGDYR